MDENRTKKKDNESNSDIIEWMLAIDLFEVRHARQDLHKDFPDSKTMAIGLNRGD
jgi:hypothetical protein